MLALSLGSAAHAEFPRVGVADIPNGVSAPFDGFWAAGIPDANGADGVSPDACKNPIQLRANGDHGLVYAAPNRPEIVYELSEFSGRTTWLPIIGESTIAVWISADAFYAYAVGLTDGRARWDDPRLYRRCPE